MATKKLFKTTRDIDANNPYHTAVMEATASNLGCDHLVRKGDNARDIWNKVCMAFLESGMGGESKVERSLLAEANMIARDVVPR